MSKHVREAHPSRTRAAADLASIRRPRPARTDRGWISVLASLLCLAGCMAGCGGSSEPSSADRDPDTPPSATPTQGTGESVAGAGEPGAGGADGTEKSGSEAGRTPVDAFDIDDGRTSIVFLGDSLTAGFGLDGEQAFPALVERALVEEGRAVRVVNAGVSGDTTAGGLRRLGWLLRQEPDILVVGLGANDGLRGQDLESSEGSLRQIVAEARQAGARVLLLGMLIPPNYGEEYTSAFAAIYPRLASELGVPLIPFLLEGVAGDPSLNQADGIHPTAEGQEILARTVLPYVRSLLDEVKATPASSEPETAPEAAPGPPDPSTPD
ncbi:MAG: arylesterase [Holophagales bacterium]|nr:arylesterase [Holophagales bacterium]